MAFAAPSFGCTFEPYISAFKSAVMRFDSLGYKAIIGDNVYADCGIGISNTPMLCGRELQAMYSDDNSSILIAAGGGELMCEILDYVDFDKIAAAEPKWYMGFSDNTNFTFLLTTLCDVASIYGPHAGAFGMEPWHRAINDAYDLITGRKLKFGGYDYFELESLKDAEHPLAAYNATEPSVITVHPKENVSFDGIMLGGCLDVLANLVGTKYDKVRAFNEKYKDKGVIWFLEACDLNVMSIRRAMWQLYEAGWFENAKGFIFGRPMHYDEPEMGLDRKNAVLDIVDKCKVPAILDADIGHLPPCIPVICGSMGHVEAANGRYTVEYRLF